jgi:transaldolase
MFWINNPTRRQADLAIEHGALGCTHNPSYTQKMLDHPEEKEYAYQLLDEAIRETETDVQAAILFQQKIVKPIAEKFLPMFEESGGEHGYVSIQGDPIHDEDGEVIYEESLFNRKVAPNICCKIPVTQPGIDAMKKLVPLDIPLNATEIFAVNQMTTICDTYEQLSKESGKKPKLFMSHIAGIYDDHFQNYVEEHAIDIAPDVLHQAGLAVARKVYNILIERGYNATFIGGGARGLHHFTEMVGGKAVVTINWEGTADRLIAQDPPVVHRLFNPVPQYVIDELMEKLPDFRRGYLDDGLSVEEFEHFGPVLLFRSAFVKSWTRVLGIAKERRAALGLK